MNKIKQVLRVCGGGGGGWVGVLCCVVLCALNVRAKLLEENVVIING